MKRFKKQFLSKDTEKRTLMKWSLILSFGFSSVFAFAQDYKVNGVVKDLKTGEALIGATVLEQGTSNGAITDINGAYSLRVSSDDAVIVFSIIGFITISEPLAGRTTIDVDMEQDIEALDEVVVIGYGTQRKKEVTGAVARLKTADITQFATSDVGAAIQGQVAGVNVQASSGEPGANANIQIRGITSITGTNDPLFVIDGIPQPPGTVPNLSNNEIESMDILKDAASASIYGTRAAAGVIIITTKRAKSGEFSVSAEGFYGVQNITSGIPLLNTQEWAYSYFKRRQGFDQFEPGKSGTDIFNPLELNERGATNNTSIIDQIQNDLAPIQNYTMTLSGGTENLSNTLVIDYFNQDGSIINSSYERLNTRLNTSFKKGKLSVNTGISIRLEERFRNTTLSTAYRYLPYQDPFDPSNTSALVPGADADVQNAINILQDVQTTRKNAGGVLAPNIIINFEITDEIGLFARGGGRFANSLDEFIKPNVFIFDDDGELRPTNPFNESEIRLIDNVSTSQIVESGATYNKKFGDGHELKFLTAFTAERYTTRSFRASGRNQPTNIIPVLDETDPETATARSSNLDDVSTLVGMLGRVQYNYKSRYLLSASVRRDGSSKFAPENRFAIFPSASVGWNLANESFFGGGIAEILSDVKIRASYGTVGNQSIPSYQFDPTVTRNQDYPLGAEGDSRLGQGTIQTRYFNPDLIWETSRSVNLGLDLAALDNRLTFTADFFNTDKSDLLFRRRLPASTGVDDRIPNGDAVILNIGNMTNKGMEYALGFRNRNGAFQWGVNYTFTKIINEVTRTATDGSGNQFPNSQGIFGFNGNEDRVTFLREGFEAGAFFLQETRGTIKTDEELAFVQQYLPDAQKGDLFYIDQITEDTDGDGVLDSGDGQIDDRDRVYAGSGLPEFEMGLRLNASYKGFALSMQWYGSFGNEVYNGAKLYAYVTGTHRDLLNSWSEENNQSNIPIIQTGATANLNSRAWADVWVEDGTFVRLRNINFSYSLPQRLISKASMNEVTFYIAADNALTITKYTGFDPEVGSDGLARRGLDTGNYPISSQYRLGVRLRL